MRILLVYYSGMCVSFLTVQSIVAVFLNRGPGFPPFVGYFLFVKDDSSFELRYDGIP